jgi:hypothetical protein
MAAMARESCRNKREGEDDRAEGDKRWFPEMVHGWLLRLNSWTATPLILAILTNCDNCTRCVKLMDAMRHFVALK